MLLGLGLPALGGVDDEQAGHDPAHAGQHVAEEADVAGHVDERDDEAVDLRVGEAEVDGQAPGLLLGPAVGVGAGQGLDQGRLAVVDVPGGGDDVQPAQPLAAARRTQRRRRPGRPCAGRAACGRRRPGRSPGPARPAARRGGRRRGRCRPRGSRRRARCRHRRPQARSTTSPTPSASARARRSVDRTAPPCARTGCRRPAGRGRRAPSSCSAASTRPPGRRARASGWRAQAATRSARPAMIPAWGPPSSLSPENVTRSAPASRRLAHGGLVPQPGRRAVGQPRAGGVEQARARGPPPPVRPEAGQGRHVDGLGEAGDAVVGLVDLEQQARRRG